MRSRGEGEIEGEIGVIVRRAARSTRGAIDERTRRTIALLVNRATRRMIAPISPSPRDLIFSSATRSQFDWI